MNRLVFLLPAAILASCSALGFQDEEKPKLTGQRIDVTLQPTQLAPASSALQEQFAIPEPQAQPNWSQAGGNAAHVPGHVEMPQGVVRAWSYNMGGGSSRGSTLTNAPVVDSGRLFATNTKGEVVALDARTGKRLWQVKLPLEEEEQSRISGGVAVLGNLLFVTSGEGKVFALTATTGKEVWKTDLAVPLRAAPNVEGERVTVISHDNRTFVLSALDGSLAWTHNGMEEALTSLKAAPAAAGNGVVAVPYSSGEIYVLRASDGRYIWHDTLSSPFSGQDPQSTLTAIAAPPVLADGLLYVVGLNGGLSAYGVANGQRFWKTDVITSQLPIVAGYQIFALTDKGEMVAINRRDGGIRWVSTLNSLIPEKKANDSRLWSGPILAGNRLIAASSDGIAVSINPQTGQRIAATDLGDGTTIPPIVADGALFFLTSDGRIICFRAPSK